MSRCLVLCLVLSGACDSSETSETDPRPPVVAHDDSFTIAEDGTGTISQGKLLENDENLPFLSSPGFKIVTPPAHGTFATSYEPAPGYFGADSFVYSVRDSYGNVSMATVTIEITSDNIPYESATQIDTGRAAGIAAGDIDGDGRIDLVTIETATSSAVVLANRTQAAGQYEVERFGFEGGHQPVAVAVADVDGDGRLDIITAARSDGLVVLRNLTVSGGPISFAGPAYLPTRNAVGVVAADFDGDSRPDLAAIDDYDDAVEVWLNAGGGTFGPRTAFAAPADPVQLLVDDADGNGSSDLAMLGRGTGQLSILLNATSAGATTPVFGARLDRGTGSQPSNMFLADLDGDGDREIAVLHDSEALWIYANQSAAPATPSFEAARVLNLPGPFSTADRTLIAAVDLDGQGPLDMMLATQGATPCTFLTNRSVQQGSYTFDTADAFIGDPTLRKRVAYGAPSGVLFAELDGVPPVEIVVSAKDGAGGQAGVFVLFGR